jgi:linoleoyl-CoA desaturase
MYKVTFNNKNSVFYSAVKKEVENYFHTKHINKTGNWRLFLKSIVLISSAVSIYIFLLAFPWSITGLILMSGLLGFILASIGFNIMHDANHGSYSEKKWVNEILGYSLNALGGNAFIWKIKHNIIHHTYTNVDGIDDDIAITKLLRQADTQNWSPKHRFQHVYVLGIYAITSIAWTFFTDFKKYFNQKIQITPISNMTAREHVIFWGSKILYIGVYILLPLLLKGWMFWLLFFISMHIVLGFTLAIVFQLAHVVEHTEFEVATIDPKQIENEWAIYQVKTTANFAPENKIISWFVGGLNFQIEHHLFPRVSHVHYPAISKIVKKICNQFNIPYNEFPTMTQAVASHFRIMRKFGKRPLQEFAMSN